MWVALIEKAYAKLFGSYEAIEAGKVHQALVDLTNGASEEIRLNADSGGGSGGSGSGSASGGSNQLSVLWSKLQTAFKSGYLIGAGSNSGSDTKNQDGIYFGHAYAVVDLYADDEVKLVQLRNPWYVPRRRCAVPVSLVRCSLSRLWCCLLVAAGDTASGPVSGVTPATNGLDGGSTNCTSAKKMTACFG